MNTTDPAAVRRQRQQRYTGNPSILAAAIAGATLKVVCGFVLGLAIGASVDLLRHSIIDSVFDDRLAYPTYWRPATFGILFVIGAIGLAAASTVSSKLIDLYRGGEKQPVLLTPLAFCAIAAGIVADAVTWLEPLEVGTTLDPAFHHDKPWSAFGWIMYYADIWFPVLAILVALAVVGYSIKHNRRLRQQIADRIRLLAEGSRVEGTITEVTIRTSQNDQGHRSIVGADITVKFTDPLGVDHWVKRLSRNRSAMPGPGFAEVLFDPQRPEVDELIFVTFERDPGPGDWIGTIA
jgi:hypothetical protein